MSRAIHALLPLSLAVVVAACSDTGLTAPDASEARGGSSPTTRTYYIAADKVLWDYAPAGMDVTMGQPFNMMQMTWVGNTPGRIGRQYYKALYREYTDGTFGQLAEVAPEWEHLGTLGPAVRGSVGDTIRIVFKNNLDRPVSVHPHGVFYDKDSEGTPYDDGTTGDDKADDAVPPGGTHEYVWEVPDRAGPGPNDPSSIAWLYHSHTNEVRDTNTGLIGPIIITARGQGDENAAPKNVDREFVTLFSIYNENLSWYQPENIATFAPAADPAGDPGWEQSNLMHAMNGWVYGNLPLGSMTMRNGDRVRWYVMALGSHEDLHTPHWHGQTGLWNGNRVDVVELLPASMKVVDMDVDNPGIWMYHCHVNHHIVAGMMARFQVLP